MPYQDSLKDLIHIVRVASNFSIQTTNMPVQDWRKMYGSWIFAKLCSHSLTLLRIEKTPSKNSNYNLPTPFLQ